MPFMQEWSLVLNKEVNCSSNELKLWKLYHSKNTLFDVCSEDEAFRENIFRNKCLLQTMNDSCSNKKDFYLSSHSMIIDLRETSLQY